VDKRNSSAPDPLHVKRFSAVIIEYLLLGEIMGEFSLHSAALKEIKGPPA